MTKLSTVVFALLASGAAAGIAAISGAQSAQVQYPKLIAKDPKKPTVAEYVEYMKLLMDEKLLTSFMGEPEATPAFMAMARSMGATATAPGKLGAYLKSSVNKGFGLDASLENKPSQMLAAKTQTTLPGTKAVKIRYGPYLVPSVDTANSRGDKGMLVDWPHINASKPCAGDCTILAMTPGLEFLDGKVANIDTGMWLHHMVLFNHGPGRQEETCKQEEISAPHAVVGGTSRNIERFFASGNERTVVNFQKMGYDKIGYKIRNADSFAIALELMNMNPEHKKVYFTITYDFVDGHPYTENVKPVWFDARNCGTSHVNPPPKKTKFTIDWSWTPTDFKGGEIMGIWGGAAIRMEVDGKPVCTNVAQYGTTDAYKDPPMAMGAPHAGHSGRMTHLSQINNCLEPGALKVKEMKPGQVWTARGDYDFVTHPGMKEKVKDEEVWDEVMSISLFYIRQKA